MSQPLVVNWGFGLNSTAMILEMLNRGIKPDLVIAADTLGEKPETYEFARIFEEYLLGDDAVAASRISVVTVTRGITKVRQSGRTVETDAKSYISLEENCLINKTLPSIAFGYKSCSAKWKREPIEWFEAIWPPAVKCWQAGGKVTKAIGYDFGEQRRATIRDDEKYNYWYPLIEWGFNRSDCERIVRMSGLPPVPKSACFYCPSSKKPELVKLKIEHPDLFARAVAMEENAILDSVKGLGRSFSWKEFETTNAVEVIEQSCMCFDGE